MALQHPSPYLTSTDRTYDVRVDGLPWFGIDDFISLFLAGGPLSRWGDSVAGARALSLKNHTFQITFGADGTSNLSTIGSDFVKKHSDDVPYTYKNTPIKVRAQYPEPPTQVVTLTPINMEWSEDDLLHRIRNRGWGDVIKVVFGTYAKHRNIRNGYAHVHIANAKTSIIPSKLVLDGRNVYVTRPGEEHLPQCHFCKVRGHYTSMCPRKETCEVCKKKGHFTVDCRRRPQQNQQKQQQQQHQRQRIRKALSL